jgi:hypothetical protein
VAEVDKWRQVFVALSPFELLAYASLYVFEKLVPQEFGLALHSEETQPDIEKTWPAINETLAWKLSDCEEISLKLTNSAIGQSLAKHLSPFLFPSQEGQVARYELREAFERLMDAQVELDSYISQSADAYSYDHSIEFVRFGTHLEIIVAYKDARATWERDSRKLVALHKYWFYRALEAFVDSGLATQPIGRPENQEANQLAYIKALRTKLRMCMVSATQYRQTLVNPYLFSKHFCRLSLCRLIYIVTFCKIMQITCTRLEIALPRLALWR